MSKVYKQINSIAGANGAVFGGGGGGGGDDDGGANLAACAEDVRKGFLGGAIMGATYSALTTAASGGVTAPTLPVAAATGGIGGATYQILSSDSCGFDLW